MKNVRIAELAWPEYDARVKDGKTMVLLPIGALEQHGHHMSMNPDVLLPTAIAERWPSRSTPWWRLQLPMDTNRSRRVAVVITCPAPPAWTDHPDQYHQGHSE